MLRFFIGIVIPYIGVLGLLPWANTVKHTFMGLPFLYLWIFALMLKLINTAYYGFTQFFPAIIAMLFLRNINPVALSLGILVGQASVVYADMADLRLGGINIGLISLCLNIIVVAVGTAIFKSRHSSPPIYRSNIS